MAELLEALAAELERPRELSARVRNYVSGTYNVDPEDIGVFLVEGLPRLEDYEIDLILSPVFTPKLQNQAVFGELLGRNSIPRIEWPRLIEQLASRPVRAQLVTPDGLPHSVVLREVTIERYVHRLRLDGSISEPVFKIVNNVSPASDRAMLKAVARQAVWESAGAQNILISYLSRAVERAIYALADTIQLLNLVENRKPADLSELVEKLPVWQDALLRQITVGSGKPFFHDDIRAMHGGGRDQRPEEDARVSTKENELAFLKRLQQVLSG
jgi:hypothetical protein